jgi:hypothetical protein
VSLTNRRPIVAVAFAIALAGCSGGVQRPTQIAQSQPSRPAVIAPEITHRPTRPQLIAVPPSGLPGTAVTLTTYGCRPVGRPAAHDPRAGRYAAPGFASGDPAAIPTDFRVRVTATGVRGRFVIPYDTAPGMALLEVVCAGVDTGNAVHYFRVQSRWTSRIHYGQLCRRSQLAVTPGPRVSEATEQATFAIKLVNQSGRGCYLTGYPVVTLRDRARSVLPSRTVDHGDLMITSARPRIVELPPGGRAYLAINEMICQFHRQRDATTVAFELGGVGLAWSLPIGNRPEFDYCTQAGPAVLDVSPVEPSFRSA